MVSTRTRPPTAIFLSAIVVIFVLTLSAADSIGFVPCYLDGTECVNATNTVALSGLPQLGERALQTSSSQLVDESNTVAIVPERIQSSTIDMDLPVQDSSTRDIEALYGMLVNGPVRYVDSAILGEEGNMLIFGHSTSLPIVKNKMYKAFNRVSELRQGDAITVSGGGKTFLYSVTSVTSVDVKEGIIDLSKERGKRLTLVTCDTLTGKDARFVVEATFVGSY